MYVVSRYKITVVGKFIVFWFEDYDLCFINANVQLSQAQGNQPEKRKMT